MATRKIRPSGLLQALEIDATELLRNRARTAAGMRARLNARHYLLQQGWSVEQINAAAAGDCELDTFTDLARETVQVLNRKRQPLTSREAEAYAAAMAIIEAADRKGGGSLWQRQWVSGQGKAALACCTGAGHARAGCLFTSHAARGSRKPSGRKPGGAAAALPASGREIGAASVTKPLRLNRRQPEGRRVPSG